MIHKLTTVEFNKATGFFIRIGQSSVDVLNDSNIGFSVLSAFQSCCDFDREPNIEDFMAVIEELRQKYRQFTFDIQKKSHGYYLNVKRYGRYTL